MTKQEELWLEQAREIREKIRAGEIEVDNNYYYFSDGEAVQILRGDFIPLSERTIDMEMDYLDGKLVEVWSEKANMMVLRRQSE